MKFSNRRSLTKEDLILWDQVQRSLDQTKKPLDKKKQLVKKQSKPLLEKPRPSEGSLKAGKIFLEKDRGYAYQKNTASINGASGLDKKKKALLRKGKIEPEKILDLHGFKTKQAEKKVVDFLQHSYMQGVRLILIITGKGNRSKEENSSCFETKTGILRKSLLLWIENSHMRSSVLEVSFAHTKHGGDGAYYVYLRKPKR